MTQMESRLYNDPELQRMLTEAVEIGQNFTTQVYEAHKHRQACGEPPESYFNTEEKLRVAFAGKAKLELSQREGYEFVRLESPPSSWPEDSELVMRHHIKREKDDDQELCTTYQIRRLGGAGLRLVKTTEDITERNIWKRARDDDGPQLHEDFAVHLELAGMRMARYSHDLFYAHKEEEALGLHDAGVPEAQDVLTLLKEGNVQMPGADGHS